MADKRIDEATGVETVGHSWDGIEELNNPLPRWWLYGFWFLILFSVVYLVLYPGLGKFEGIWNWSSGKEWQDEKTEVDAKFNKVFEPFMSTPADQLAKNPEAVAMGKNLYMTYCMQCHGSDAQGVEGKFPNLADAHWLFGGDAESIKASITGGRTAEMPAGLAGDEQGAKEVANYVLKLGNKPHDEALATAGQAKYAACEGCHGADGTGMAAASFPNIVDDAWMYGSSEGAIIETIVKGRKGGMPAQPVNEAKAHLLTAYVLSLSGK